MLLGIGLCFPRWAAAQTPSDEARRLSDEGLAHFKQGEYDAAIDSFRASYQLSPLPVLLFNLAQAFRRKGDCTQALALYQRYLNEEPLPTNRDKVDERIREMRACATPAQQNEVPSA